MTPPQNEPSPAAFAFGWVARMTTVVLEMGLPGVGGHWLDSKFGTNFWALAGFGIGFTMGLTHLMQMIKQHSPNAKPSPEDEIPPSQNNKN